MNTKKFLLPSIIILLFVLFGGSINDAEKLSSLFFEITPTTKPSKTLGTSDQQMYLVTNVIDGDTIELENGQKVRYIGIDTPELKGNECFAVQARDKNKELVEGKRVKLQKDVSETDRYGRLLRFVYTDDGNFINNTLVRDGYATVSTYPPDISQQQMFRESQQEAMELSRGLWGAGCK